MSNRFNAATPLGEKNTKTDTWITPSWVMENLGLFDLDPCGFLKDGKPIVETARHYYTEADDGLSKEWFGDVFVNFPYSQSRQWLAKCREYGDAGGNVVVLCFCWTETKAWQDNVKTAYGVNFLDKRISFLNENGLTKTNGNAPSCLIAWGEQSYERIKKLRGILARIDVHK